MTAGAALSAGSAFNLKWLALAALALAPLTVCGQSGESGIAAETKRGVFSFTRIGQRAKRAANTQILPGAREIWRRDNDRESRKNANYWSIFRSRDLERIAGAGRAEMNRKLQAIKARADAYRAFNTAKATPRGPVVNSAEESTGRIIDFPRNETTPSPDAPPRRKPGKPRTTTDGEKMDPVTKIADTIDETFKPGRLSEAPRPASFVLALLAVILVPSFAGFLLLAGFLNLRHGYWLRGGVFAVGGLFLGLLIYVTAFHREKIPDRQELLAQCRDTSLTVTASVLELQEDGAVLASLSAKDGKNAETDRNGYAFLYTEKLDSISGGENFTRLVYPVGNIRTYNVFGLGADMPAYTDSLEKALAHRKEEALAENWWHRLLQPLVES